MGRFQISIARLMFVMIAIAVGLAALHSAQEYWVIVVFNLVAVALLVATYKAKCSPGIAGVWWTGFASVGWAHLVLGLIGMPWGQHFGVSPALATEYFTERLVTLLEPDTSAAAAQRWTARFLILHSLMSLVLALLGATIFSLFAARRHGVRAGSSPPD
jgi:hypothetical protein